MVDRDVAEGGYAVLEGLEAKPELNGSMVRVGAFDEAVGRWECELLVEGNAIRARPNNLVALDARGVGERVRALAADAHESGEEDSSYVQLYDVIDVGVLDINGAWEAANAADDESSPPFTESIVRLIDEETAMLLNNPRSTMMTSMLLTIWLSVLRDADRTNNYKIKGLDARRCADFFRAGGLSATLRCMRAALSCLTEGEMLAAAQMRYSNPIARVAFDPARSLKFACCQGEAVRALLEAGFLDAKEQQEELTWWMGAENAANAGDYPKHNLEGSFNLVVAELVLLAREEGRDDIAKALAPPEGTVNEAMFNMMAIPSAQQMIDDAGHV